MFDRTLYKKHSNGKIGTWRIHITVVDGVPQIIREACKLMGGAAVTTTTPVTQGKNIGRSNETSSITQAILEATSKYQHKLDEGYERSPPLEGAKVTNSLNFPRPMLAQPIAKVRKWEYPVLAQPKFDGHRMLAATRNGTVVLYSRQGKVVEVEHVRRALQDAYNLKLWDGTTLDGEIYLHGETLQKIASLVKRPQEQSKELVYHLYDIMQPLLGYDKRLVIIAKLVKQLPTTSIVLTRTTVIENAAELEEFHAKMIGENYEGTIIRQGSRGYEDGKRSQSLMKKKDFMDAEFEIVGYKLGKADIKSNTTYERPILQCKAAYGEIFSVTAPGTMIERHTLYTNGLEKLLHKKVTVKYSCLTPAGIPFHGVAMRIREDI